MNKFFTVLFVVIIVSMSSFADIFFDFRLDTNNNGKVDRWIKAEVDKKWELLDINRNKKADEGCFYVSDKNIVFRITEERQDYDGDGKPDIWIKVTYNGRDFAKEISIDSNGDKKIDFITYEKNDFKYMEKYDLNYDGLFDSIEEYTKDGYYSQKEFIKDKMVDVVYNKVIVKRSEDTNYDGKMDTFFWTEEHYNGKEKVASKPTQEEFDKNFDGVIDIWMTISYDSKGSMKDVVTKYDNNYDGKIDEWRYANARGEVIKRELDTNGDGTPDKTENNPKDLTTK